MGDTECTLYNAKCYHSASAEMSCYCSVDQMLDGMMCIDGNYLFAQNLILIKRGRVS